jgi:mannose-1-phosphate guanylyltransferase
MGMPKQAMVLAAGRGTRLGALGERKPKALIEIGDEPLLAHQLRHLGAQGIERVVVNASHLAEQLEEFAADWRGTPELELVIEPEPLGTAGGVLNALPLFTPDPILVLYGDVVSTETLEPMAALHHDHRPVATLAVFQSADASEKGVVEVSASRINAFHEKNPRLTRGWVNAGIYIVEPSWLGEWRDRDAPLDFGFDLFPAAVRSGRPLRAYRLVNPVLDIGTPRDLARARELRSSP